MYFDTFIVLYFLLTSSNLNYVGEHCCIESQGNTPVQISPNDSLGQVFGKKHSRRVRGVRDGVSPSQVFGSTNPRFSAYSSSFKSVEQNRVTQLENQV